MSTHSRIGIMSGNSVRSIYCHWDGHLDTNGKMLLEEYQDAQKINDLIDLGSISCLKSIVHPEGKHTFSEPAKDTVIAYGRDRGDMGTQADVSSMEEFKEMCEPFKYIFIEGKWQVLIGASTKDSILQELTQELIKLVDID